MKTVVPDIVQTTVYSVSNSAGTAVDTDGDDPLTAGVDESTLATDTVYTEEGFTRIESSTVWDGDIHFMIRWTPTESLVVDFMGSMLMDALDFGLFAGDSGVPMLPFNPANFVSSLGMSVTFLID